VVPRGERNEAGDRIPRQIVRHEGDAEGVARFTHVAENRSRWRLADGFGQQARSHGAPGGRRLLPMRAAIFDVPITEEGRDATGARVHGRPPWAWAVQHAEVCGPVMRPSRGHGVIHEVLGDHRPTVWVSDLYSAQKNHPAEQWQVCLAHQLRDCQFAIEAGDAVFAPRMKAVLLRAFAIHKRCDTLAASTLYQYQCDLQRRVHRCLALEPANLHGRRLQKRYTKIQDHLFLFLDDAAIPPTNNTSEQAIRMSTVFRKVTNGFRSTWGRDLFAAVRSVVNTGKRQGLSAFQSIQRALSPVGSLFNPG
jgi:transposase